MCKQTTVELNWAYDIISQITLRADVFLPDMQIFPVSPT